MILKYSKGKLNKKIRCIKILNKTSFNNFTISIGNIILIPKLLEEATKLFYFYFNF